MRESDSHGVRFSSDEAGLEGSMFEARPWGNMSQEEFFATLPVFDMFPLSEWQKSSLSWYALVSFGILKAMFNFIFQFYAILFLIGVFGNTSVITGMLKTSF